MHTMADPERVARLLRDVGHLGLQLGERNDRNDRTFANLKAAATHIADAFTEAGHVVRFEPYMARGREVENVLVEISGTRAPGQVIVVGAHYDSARRSPGSNDNATGVAVLLEMARRLARVTPSCAVRLVAFANEEQPHTRTRTMGSMVHARGCRDRQEDVLAMISLETLGCHAPDGVDDDALALPARISRDRDGLHCVGNVPSSRLVEHVAGALRRNADFPVRPLALPGFLPGARSSDHWSFWKLGYPGVMLTDGGPIRYRHYHSRHDTPDKVNIERLAQVCDAVTAMVLELASAPAMLESELVEFGWHPAGQH